MQAGLLAGMAVAAFFFVADLVRLAPLYTPLHLSQSLIGAGLSLDTGGVLAAAAGFSPGGRLAAFTGVYLAAFAGFGILAAALANLFHVKWNARTGAAAGLLSGLTAWFAASRAGAAWIDAAHSHARARHRRGNRGRGRPGLAPEAVQVGRRRGALNRPNVRAARSGPGSARALTERARAPG